MLRDSIRWGVYLPKIRSEIDPFSRQRWPQGRLVKMVPITIQVPLILTIHQLLPLVHVHNNQTSIYSVLGEEKAIFATTWPVAAVYVSKWVLTVLIHNVKSTFKFIHYLVSQWVVLYGYIWPWCPDSYQTPPRKQPDLEPTFTTIDTCMPWSWGRYQCLRALFVCIKIIFDSIRLQ